jgi:tetratricopeptide (TPR) repeat protein
VGQLEEWLKLAPPPSPLEAGRKWHVFLSYRSTERKWVLGLYDILTQLKYHVFMDQFVLVAGEGLASSIGENLDASQAGVLVWSVRSDDSAWCKKEYNSFEAREANGDFKFVAVRLQDAQLPAFVNGALWIDASSQRDGPRGTSLLRLLYGLQGKPLPPEAVQMAARIDETTNNDLASIRSHANGRDADEIVRLVENRKDDLAWQAGPVLACAAAQALISIGSPEAAVALLKSVRAAFPAAVRPRQLTGLALARMRSWKEAKAVLGELYELGERDPETVGIYARTWMDAYEATRDRLMLRRSRDLYAEGFAKASSDFYLGINAAAKSIFLDEVAAGNQLAKAVEQIVGTQPKPGDYWQSATIAEAQLIQRNFDIAATRYEQAIAMAPGAVDDHRSTCKQARLLLKHLDATPEQVARVLGIFRREVDSGDAQSAVDGIRSQGRARVVTFLGFSGAGYEDEAEVRQTILEELKNFDPSDTLVCAGATVEGIGMVYPLALQKGFRTAGVVSSLARAEGAKFSTECEIVFVVDDKTWGGKLANGRLSATSQAMVSASDVMIGIGGGAITRDELEEGRKKGKTVRFHKADMDHARATEKAAKAGNELPKEFGGDAQTLFQDQCKEEGS